MADRACVSCKKDPAHRLFIYLAIYPSIQSVRRYRQASIWNRCQRLLQGFSPRVKKRTGKRVSTHLPYGWARGFETHHLDDLKDP